MKLQPKLQSRTATLPRAAARYLSPVIARCCFALLLCVVIPRAGLAQTLTTLANFTDPNFPPSDRRNKHLPHGLNC